MFEKVNPSHPDKIADRIAGALVDIAYAKQENPKIAVEVLIGHGQCTVIIESSVIFERGEVEEVVNRISDSTVKVTLVSVPQDAELAKNQERFIRCGDNGIFKGVPVTNEQKELCKLAETIYSKYPTDGKYIIDDKNITICQSCCEQEDLIKILPNKYEYWINPLGAWKGGINTDAGATNRKLGSDMADSVTGGGTCGKDLSKADVSVNIFVWLLAQSRKKTITACCSIGDEIVKVVTDNDKVELYEYKDIVDIAKTYINAIGGFEKFAEWGLVRYNNRPIIKIISEVK